MDSRVNRGLKSAAKRGIDAAFYMKVKMLTSLGLIDFPVPPNHNLRTTSSKTVRHYYESGITTALPISVAAMCEGFDLQTGDLAVLDFGCGAGRQLLHMTKWFPRLRLSGCDVDFDAIRFVQSAYPQVDVYANAFDPPLKYEDATFDIVYSLSIFSHLSPESRDEWLRELYRILRPGGIAALTYNGLTSLAASHARGQHQQYTPADLAQRDYIFEAIQDNAASISRRNTKPAYGERMIGVTGVFGDIYHHPEKVQKYFAVGGFEFCRRLEGIVDGLQDLVIIKKPAIAHSSE